MKYSKAKIARLENTANILRKEVLEMVYEAGSGHIGGSFSIAEIISVLFFEYLKIQGDKNNNYNLGDVLVLSKGHASPILYSALYEKGYIQSLKGFRDIVGKLEGHPTNNIPTVQLATGSLGQGLSFAVGISLAKRLNDDNSKVVTIIGDGEMQEGQIWEAFLSVSKYNLSNLTIIIDANNVQLDGNVKDIKNIYPIREKLESYNMEIIEIDGHNVKEILDALNMESSKPKVIIANTIKGKGVSFMENNYKWHGKAPNEKEYNEALKEINDVLKS